MSEKSTEAELVVIEQKHLRWLCNEEGGERTDLRGAHLRRADLRGTDLTEADLRGTDLTEANLNGARTETEEEAQNEARNGRD